MLILLNSKIRLPGFEATVFGFRNVPVKTGFRLIRLTGINHWYVHTIYRFQNWSNFHYLGTYSICKNNNRFKNCVVSRCISDTEGSLHHSGLFYVRSVQFIVILICSWTDSACKALIQKSGLFIQDELT